MKKKKNSLTNLRTWGNKKATTTTKYYNAPEQSVFDNNNMENPFCLTIYPAHLQPTTGQSANEYTQHLTEKQMQLFDFHSTSLA